MRLNAYRRRNPHSLPLIPPLILPCFAVSYEDGFKLVGVTTTEISCKSNCLPSAEDADLTQHLLFSKLLMYVVRQAERTVGQVDCRYVVAFAGVE